MHRPRKCASRPSVVAFLLGAVFGFTMNGHKFSSQFGVALEPDAGLENDIAGSGNMPHYSDFSGQHIPSHVASSYMTWSTEKQGPPVGFNQTALWGHQTRLTPSQIQRGIVSMGDQARLRRAVHKLMRGDSLTIAAVGSSITAGAGGTNLWPSYVDQFVLWLRRAFPNANINFKNAALGATTADMYSVCVERMIPSNVDMVILEFSITNSWVHTNCDCKDNPSVTTSRRASYERLLRKLLAMPECPAVVLMQYYHWRAARGSFYDSIESDLNVQAAYYGTPVLSVRSAAYHAIAANQSGFQVAPTHEPVKDERGQSNLYYYDRIHPNGPTGHRYMAELLIGLIQSTSASLILASWDDNQRCNYQLPKPMIPGNADKTASVCMLRKDFKPAVVASHGFDFINERPDAPTPNQEKWGYVAYEPGSTAEIVIDTRTHDLQVNSNHSKSQVVLGYLASYNKMGQAKVECIANCTCKSSMFDALWDRKVSLMQMHSFQVSVHQWCRIRVTVLETTRDQDNGTKITLSGIIVMSTAAFDFAKERSWLAPATFLDKVV